LIADQVIQKRQSIFSGKLKDSALRQINDGARFPYGCVLGLSFTEGADDFDIAIRLCLGLCLSMEINQWVGREISHWMIYFLFSSHLSCTQRHVVVVQS
jgi:hypothetical protein